VPAPYYVTLAVYNSAGERVRTLFVGGAQVMPGSLSLSSGLVGQGLPLQVSIDGYFVGAGQAPTASIAWDGTNDQGQAVSGGVYSIKLEMRDQWGVVTTMQQVVQALPQQPATALVVFNSAGEEVQRLVLPASLGNAPVQSMALAQGVLVLDGLGALGGSSQPLKVTLRSEPGVSAQLTWGGLNAFGRPVDPGLYTLELVTTQPGGAGLIVATSSVQVVKVGQRSLQGLVVAPQPWTPAGPLAIRFTPCPGLRVRAQLFNVAGEEVRQAEAPGDGGGMELEARGLAAGIYLLELRLLQGEGGLDRVLRKVVLVP
jgi:hypothetical protein